jgi:Sortase domain
VSAGPASSRLPNKAVQAVAWGVLLLCLWVWGRSHTGDGGKDAMDGASAAQVLAKPGPPARKPMNAAGPQGIDIGSVGVHAVVGARGLDRNGAVDPPPFTSPDEVAWYRGGAKPGAMGVAIFVGHMDTRSRPAVFYRLGDIRPGETIKVDRVDGTAAVFTVERVETVDKRNFDAGKVYGPHRKGRAEIRVLTCGGAYEPRKRNYTGNLVVSGYLTGTSR